MTVVRNKERDCEDDFHVDHFVPLYNATAATWLCWRLDVKG